MYFKDNSNYNYYVKKPIYQILNVGWLSGQHSYTSGEVKPYVIKKLKEILFSKNVSDYKFNRIRCNSPCEICGKCVELDFYDHNKQLKTNFLLGFCEILIPLVHNDIYYASPALIFHYIQEHNYKPPQEFIDSILALDLTQPFNAQDFFDNLTS